MGLADLPYLTERPRQACPKGKTRLELTTEKRPLTKIDEKAFRDAVWLRDNYKCRACKRPVLRTIARVPERGEVNHLHGRTGDLRWDVRAAALMCLECHERFTGKVNAHRLVAIPTKTFTTRQGEFTDARFPIIFKEVK